MNTVFRPVSRQPERADERPQCLHVSNSPRGLTLAVDARSQGVVQLAICLNEEKDDHIRGAAVWALGQIGRHTPEHAKAIAMANLFPKLLEVSVSAKR